MIFQLVAKLNHEINWKNAKVFGKFDNTASRKFMESCHSIDIVNTFNRFAEYRTYVYIYQCYVMNYSINSFTGASEAPAYGGYVLVIC